MAESVRILLREVQTGGLVAAQQKIESILLNCHPKTKTWSDEDEIVDHSFKSMLRDGLKLNKRVATFSALKEKEKNEWKIHKDFPNAQHWTSILPKHSKTPLALCTHAADLVLDYISGTGRSGSKTFVDSLHLISQRINQRIKDVIDLMSSVAPSQAFKLIDVDQSKITSAVMELRSLNLRLKRGRQNDIRAFETNLTYVILSFVLPVLINSFEIESKPIRYMM